MEVGCDFSAEETDFFEYYLAEQTVSNKRTGQLGATVRLACLNAGLLARSQHASG
jgi:hypothetical protein